MAQDECSSVLLVITGEEINPDEISTLMSINPLHTWKKGEKRSVKVGDNVKVFDSINVESGWKARTPENKLNAPLQEQVNLWIDLINKRYQVFKDLHKQSAVSELICYVDSLSQVSINVDSLGLLAECKIGIRFDIFAD